MPENVEERQKRQKIEAALADPDTPLSKWQEFAKTEYGLVSGMHYIPHTSFHCFYFTFPVIVRFFIVV